MSATVHHLKTVDQRNAELDSEIEDRERAAQVADIADRELDRLSIDRIIRGVITEGTE